MILPLTSKVLKCCLIKLVALILVMAEPCFFYQSFLEKNYMVWMVVFRKSTIVLSNLSFFIVPIFKSSVLEEIRSRVDELDSNLYTIGLVCARRFTKVQVFLIGFQITTRLAELVEALIYLMSEFSALHIVANVFQLFNTGILLFNIHCFYAMVMDVSERLKCIKIYLHKTSVAEKNPFYARKLETALECHRKLIEVAALTNDAFSVQIGTTVPALMFVSFAHIYQAVAIPQVPFWYRAMAIASCALLTTGLVRPCHEAAKTEKLKFHLYSKRAVVFTGLGIFKLDRPLLHSMGAAITSYLVVLLQLQYSSQASAS